MSSSNLAETRQLQAQALAMRGDLNGAVALLDRWLAANDGDWGMWLYLAGLCAKLGRVDQAVPAFCASARQLEADGHPDRAANAVREATLLRPTDRSLQAELARLELLANPLGRSEFRAPVIPPTPPPRKPAEPARAAQPRAVTPARAPSTPAPRAAPAPAPQPRRAAARERQEATTLRTPRGAAPRARMESVTDPYLAIFDILDEERASRDSLRAVPPVKAASAPRRTSAQPPGRKTVSGRGRALTA